MCFGQSSNCRVVFVAGLEQVKVSVHFVLSPHYFEFVPSGQSTYGQKIVASFIHWMPKAVMICLFTFVAMPIFLFHLVIHFFYSSICSLAKQITYDRLKRVLIRSLCEERFGSHSVLSWLLANSTTLLCTIFLDKLMASITTFYR